MTLVDFPIAHRQATVADSALLAELNKQLIDDEGHRNPMTLPELESRMRGWLAGDYTATIFERDGRVIAYALWRHEPDDIYLRQFFVARAHRREGIGRQAMRLLTDEVWPRGMRVRVEVLVENGAGLAFWRSVGFRDYSMSLEMER
ncbi:MAG: GNAT family N-acetyltransferase [Thermomicrobiales bacterium]